MIAIADINTIWRRKPFEELARLQSVLGFMPRDVRSAWKESSTSTLGGGGVIECPVILPPGWASKWPRLTAGCLWRKALKKVGNLGDNLTSFVVTSPHYLDLVRKAKAQVPMFYYCSDDYSQYAGWGGESMLKREAELVRTVQHSFFVSRSLADRAVQTYGVSPDRVSVSPNATEERFLTPVAEEQIDALFRQFPALRRPLVGVVGGVNDRLDFDLIARCAALLEVGSVVLVGEVDPNSDAQALQRLRANSACIFVGQRPHEELPTWMQALDVALIPYRDTPLNRSCSPMRLFDHMAAGRPIVATSACQQIRELDSLVRVGHGVDEVCHEIRFAIQSVKAEQRHPQKEMARQHLWSVRAADMWRIMNACGISASLHKTK